MRIYPPFSPKKTIPRPSSEKKDENKIIRHGVSKAASNALRSQSAKSRLDSSHSSSLVGKSVKEIKLSSMTEVSDISFEDARNSLEREFSWLLTEKTDPKEPFPCDVSKIFVNSIGDSSET